MKEIEIKAFDTMGNKFKKKVILRNSEFDKNRMVLDFGWPVSYYIGDLLENYPYEKDFCIDIMGRNHNGFQVCISAQDMNMLLEEFDVN